MGRNWWMKFTFLLLCTVGAGVYIAPTVLNLDLEKSKFIFKQKINLGLDLQGGVYMVLGADFKKVFSDKVERIAESLNEELKKKNITCGPATAERRVDGQISDDPRINVSCTTDDSKKAFYKIIKDQFNELRITEDKDKNYQFGLSKISRDDIREKTIAQSISVIRNRIDEFGVAEPVITSHGADKLSVELPGIKDVERAKELIGKTAKLEFKLVDYAKNDDEIRAIISEAEAKNGIKLKEIGKFSEYVKKINEAVKDKIPAGTEIAFEKENKVGVDEEGRIGGKRPYLLKLKADVTGDDLKDAFVRFDQDNRPEVDLTFNPRGTGLFAKVTSENVNKQLAIVLDGVVHSAPNINGAIPNGKAVITLGNQDYNNSMKEAKDLAIVLRAGALPAQLEFLEQRVVGPSLGADSIQKGKVASIIGCVILFIFMLIYYRVSGFIADVSLVLNVLFVMAILVGLGATLTLPGIAGIALTVGIAVDSNVVIYERIREELRLGKPSRLAVDMGFSKAFHTILDANITNAVAAIVLMNYGTGPVKGFAVTLMIGIITTFIYSSFVSKLIFDFYLERFEVKELSI